MVKKFWTCCAHSVANTPALSETCLTCVREMIGEGENKRERERKKKGRGVKAFFGSRAPTVAHIFHFPPSWKDQVIEKETIQQPRLHRCQWKASEILEYYTLGPVFVFLSHGAYGKKWLYNDNTWKVFPIRLMHHCQRGDETVLFLFGLVMSMKRQQAEEREREKERGMEGEEERCSMFSKCKVHWNVIEIRCSLLTHAFPNNRNSGRLSITFSGFCAFSLASMMIALRRLLLVIISKVVSCSAVPRRNLHS